MSRDMADRGRKMFWNTLNQGQVINNNPNFEYFREHSLLNHPKTHGKTENQLMHGCPLKEAEWTKEH